MNKWPENFAGCPARIVLNALVAAAAERRITTGSQQLEIGTPAKRIAWSNFCYDLRNLFIFVDWQWISWYSVQFLKPTMTLNDAVGCKWPDSAFITKTWIEEKFGSYPLAHVGLSAPPMWACSRGIRKNNLIWANYIRNVYNLTFLSEAGVWLQGGLFRISGVRSTKANVSFRYIDSNDVVHDESINGVVFDEYGEAVTSIAPTTRDIKKSCGIADYSCDGGFEYLDIDNSGNE